MRPGSSRD